MDGNAPMPAGQARGPHDPVSALWSGEGYRFAQVELMALGICSMVRPDFPCPKAEKVDELLGGHQPERILELGCGVGILLFALRNRRRAFFLGADISIGPLLMAQSITKTLPDPAPCFVGSSALDLPFRAGSFDLVMTSGLLSIFPETPARIILGEILKLRPALILHSEYSEPDTPRHVQHDPRYTLYNHRYPEMYVHLSPSSRLLRHEQEGRSGWFLFSRKD